MIKQLEGHLTEQQIQIIRNKIISQYREFRRLTGNPQFISLFSPEYAAHKKAYSLSWAIDSGFPSESIIAENLHIKRLAYGMGHTRPQLENDKIVVHILKDTNDSNAKYLTEFFQKNKDGFNGEQLYCYFNFKTDREYLKKISLCLPDENGTVIAEEILLDNSKIKLLTA